MHSARLRRRLPSLVARDLARRTLTVPDDLPVAEAVRRAQAAEAGSIVTVSSAGAPIGIVNETVAAGPARGASSVARRCPRSPAPSRTA